VWVRHVVKTGMGAVHEGGVSPRDFGWGLSGKVLGRDV
jgi:hypothetical protein